jgi:hypothetical protein
MFGGEGCLPPKYIRSVEVRNDSGETKTLHVTFKENSLEKDYTVEAG